MIRRIFLKSLGCIAASVACFYVPGRPWNVAVPKPPQVKQVGFTIFLDEIKGKPMVASHTYAKGGFVAETVLHYTIEDGEITLKRLPSPASSA